MNDFLWYMILLHMKMHQKASTGPWRKEIIDLPGNVHLHNLHEFPQKSRIVVWEEAFQSVSEGLVCLLLSNVTCLIPAINWKAIFATILCVPVNEWETK